MDNTVQSTAHRQSAAFDTAVHINTGRQHGNGLFAALLGSHSLQLILNGGIIRRRYIENKFGSVKAILYSYGYIEIHHARTTVITIGYRSAHTLRRFQVQRRIHRIASPVHITAVVNLEFLQRNDRKRILHNSARKRITSGKAYIALRSILHVQISATFQFNEFTAVGT